MISLPIEIKKYIKDLNFSLDDIGKSASSIMIFDDMVLKISKIGIEAKNEYIMMQYLQDKLPVPKVISYVEDNDFAYLLMSKIEGKMLCDDIYLKDHQLCLKLITKAIKMLWSVDIRNCPVDWTLSKKLHLAKYYVDNNLVDLDNVEPTTFSKTGFKTPNDLLDYLINNSPTEELCFTHGDLSLPNIIVNNDEIVGFIDLGKCGISDKYTDLSIAFRSCKDNFAGHYNKIKRVGFTKKEFFDSLDITENLDKMQYYLLLDELF